MKINKISLAVSTALFTVINANAALGPININPLILESNHFNDLDTKATFASEIYTADDIEKANASNIYDFLGQNTSISILPSFGNPFGQQIDMRGFGLSSGFENVVVTLNGRRLNNIDGVPQFLANIDLSSIKRIEITKGSGSVVYGDGATSGAIHIITNEATENQIKLTLGNFGKRELSLNAGVNIDRLRVSTTINSTRHDGFSDEDSTGNKTHSSNNNISLNAAYALSEQTVLSSTISSSDVDTRYPSALTLAQYNDDPSQAPSAGSYTHQQYDLKGINLSLKHAVSDDLSMVFEISKDEKKSEFLGAFPFVADYETKHNKFYANYKLGDVNMVSGIDLIDGLRKGSTNTTTKDNLGYFVKGNIEKGNTSYSLGLRKETVEYEFDADNAAAISDKNHLSAFDFGINHQYDDGFSVFANYNRSYQAPNIDRFFNFGGTFNAFITPAKVKTFNIGFNKLDAASKTKVTLFYSDVSNEIYFNPVTFSNTNIDKSHKYGLDYQYKRQINKQIDINVNYAYTVAIIDDDAGNAAFSGKTLPGVSKHNLTLGLGYDIDAKSKLNITSKYRSETFAANDFENKFSQKQKSYETTNVSYVYQYNDQLVITTGIENLFESSNGFWIRDDAIFPVNFTRNITLGLNYKF